MICHRPGCGKPLRPDQIRRGVRFHSKACSTWAALRTKALRREGPRPLVPDATEPDLRVEPATMRCYCGATFRAGEGWGMFHDRACGDRWHHLGFLTLEQYLTSRRIAVA